MEVTILKVILTVIFMLAIISKLTGKSKSTFENAGYSPVIMYVIAVAEVIFTIGLFTRYELFAAVGLLGIIGGAAFTLVRQKASPWHLALPVITAVLLAVLLGSQYLQMSGQCTIPQL